MLTEPQRALVSTISDGQKAVEEAERILDQKIQVPDLGTDPVSAPRAVTGLWLLIAHRFDRRR